MGKYVMEKFSSKRIGKKYVFSQHEGDNWAGPSIEHYPAINTTKLGVFSEDGKYRFFTCSKNVLWCDKPAFSGNSLIIATHGDFHIEHYSGDFNAYFCNTIIQPKNKLHYGLIYCTISQYLPILQRSSNGSIIKFIGNTELSKIPVLIPDNSDALIYFNKILFTIERNNKEISHLTHIRDWLLPMLMNGQATIED